MNLKIMGKWPMTLIILAMIATACSSGGGANEATPTSAEKPAPSGTEQTSTQKTSENKEPFPITIMSWFESVEPPKADNALIRELEERTNTKLDITWVGQNYGDKLNVTIASDELPMVVLSTGKDSVLINAVRSGMFWELGPYLQNYPNLSKLDPNIMLNASIDGKTYGIYKARSTARYGIFYRKDWLDRLNMKEPATIDEFYEMLRAFTYDDPDGNGVDDTYGLASSNFNGFYPLEIMYGAPNNWGIIDGQVIPSFMTDEYIDGLNFYRRLYEEKIINQDFASAPTTKPDEEFTRGNVGVRYTVMENYTLPFLSTDLKKIHPEAEVDMIARLEGPQGYRLNTTNGYSGMYLVSKKAVPTEAELDKVLQFLDALVGDDMIDLFNYGIEGIHYTVQNGQKILDNEKANQEVFPVRHLGMALRVNHNGTELADRILKELEENAPYAVFDASAPLISDTYAEKGKSLEKIISDARIKYIMGMIDESEWKAQVELWRQQGGDKIIEEYTTENARLHRP